MAPSVQARVLRNGNNGWYWELVNGREVLQRGVALSLEAARAQADNARHAALIELRPHGGLSPFSR
jgi:hypothetical protein